MKNIILYAVIFIAAFGVTTFGIYTYNEKYANLFEFDFRDAVEVARADSIAMEKADTLAIGDSLLTINEHEEIEKNLKKDLQVKKDFKEAKKELEKTSTVLSKREKELESLKELLEVKNDKEHEEWLKSTIKLYEAMEIGKAGQLLKALPEAEAREIIYSMKNKKAAEILSSLDTETIKRLTREIK